MGLGKFNDYVAKIAELIQRSCDPDSEMLPVRAATKGPEKAAIRDLCLLTEACLQQCSLRSFYGDIRMCPAMGRKG